VLTGSDAMDLPLRRSRLALWLDLIRWDRPAGWLLLLWPTLSALWIAAGGFPGWHLLVVFVVGTFLMRSAGCACAPQKCGPVGHRRTRSTRLPVVSASYPVVARDAAGTKSFR
jgi:4-hydroxybenzoate polyprenyltransferase